MLKVLQILSWIVFLGLCIEAGGILFNSIFSLAVNPNGAKQFWENLDLSNLYAHDKGHFFAQTLLMSIVAILKALLFYFIVKIFHDKKLNFEHPFTEEMKRFIANSGYIALGIGLFSNSGKNYAKWLISNNVVLPEIENIFFGGADVWFFMGLILFVIAAIFKKGIEIQSENDLMV